MTMHMGLILRRELVSVRGDERGDVFVGGDQAFPLRAVEGDGETAKAVEGDSAAGRAFVVLRGVSGARFSDFHGKAGCWLNASEICIVCITVHFGNSVALMSLLHIPRIPPPTYSQPTAID